jgi:AAA+ ATPase superfamily predicted ATPase
MPVSAGYHRSFDEFKYPPDIRVALRRLSEYFYVTRAFDPLNKGNSTYYAALIRPTSETSVFVNTERELLVLFSKYETFEIRTLDAFDEFYKLLDDTRLDTNLRFLVSGYDFIEEAVRHFLSQNPEYPIIVPITLKKLIGARGDPLIAAVRKNFLVRDLFAYQAPLRQEVFFFGRDEVVNTVLDYARSGQNSSLFGLRKSGKTSTIYAVARRSRPMGVTVVTVDCQDPAIHARRYDELLFHLLNAVRRQCGQKQLKELPKLSLPDLSEFFAQHMRSTLGQMKTPVLLIFDEIENISPATAASPHWTEDRDALYFWQILRSFCQSEEQTRLSICLVGTSPMLLESAKIHRVDNPVYLFAQKTFIPNLTQSEVREMVTRLGYFMGLNFPDAVIAKLCDEYGGHPFFIRQVCSKIHQLSGLNRPMDVSMRMLDRARVEFMSQMETYIREIIANLQSLYPEEFDVLAAVVCGDRADFDEYVAEAPDLVDHLIGYGLVARRGDDYDITFQAIAGAVRRLLPSAAEKSDEAAWAAMSARRGVLERSLRTALFHWSNSVGPDAWASIIQRALNKSRFEKLPSVEPRVLFSPTASPLYFTDLLSLLDDAEVLPHLADRKTSIMSSLRLINRLRKDAHALAPTSDDLELLSRAYDDVESEFVLG